MPLNNNLQETQNSSYGSAVGIRRLFCSTTTRYFTHNKHVISNRMSPSTDVTTTLYCTNNSVFNRSGSNSCQEWSRNYYINGNSRADDPHSMKRSKWSRCHYLPQRITTSRRCWRRGRVKSLVVMTTDTVTKWRHNVNRLLSSQWPDSLVDCG